MPTLQQAEKNDTVRPGQFKETWAAVLRRFEGAQQITVCARVHVCAYRAAARPVWYRRLLHES